MPKKMNTNKAAAAVYQNAKAIEDAKRSGGLFGAVTRALGNRGFEVHLGVQDKSTGSQRLVVQATPRTLFQGGKKAPIRIAVGHVVLLAGQLRPVGEQQRPLEIVGRLDSKDEIRELVKLGLMSSAILGIAETAGAVVTAEARVAEEDLFDSDGSDEDFWTAGLKDVKGGLKQQRAAAETLATIAARVATLKGQKSAKGVDGSVELGNLADPSLFADPEFERFQRWRAHKASVAAPRPSVGGAGSAAAAAPVNAEAVQTMAELMAQFKLEKESALAAAERQAEAEGAAAAAKGEETKAWLAKQSVKENWDDEEDTVRMEDL
jgi:hypothetical protein